MRNSSHLDLQEVERQLRSSWLLESIKQQAASSKQQAASTEQLAASSKQQAASSEQRASSIKQEVVPSAARPSEDSSSCRGTLPYLLRTIHHSPQNPSIYHCLWVYSVDPQDSVIPPRIDPKWPEAVEKQYKTRFVKAAFAPPSSSSGRAVFHLNGSRYRWYPGTTLPKINGRST